MVDAVSGGGKPPVNLLKAVETPAARPSRATEAGREATSVRSIEGGKLARQISSSPPVDASKVAEIRGKIATGSYHIEPERIADAMIGMEKGRG